MNTPPQSESRTDLLLLELLRRARIVPLNGIEPHDVRINSLTDDSRRVTLGGCFVAVHGTTIDGHAHVGDAARAGASAIIVDRDVPDPPGVAVVQPPNFK